MKPFYSIQELADILDEGNYSVSNGLVAAGVLSYFNGKTVDLERYDCFRPIYNGENVFIRLGGPPKPTPGTIIVSADALPESWRKRIELLEQDAANNVPADIGAHHAESSVNADHQKAAKTTANHRFKIALRNLLDEISAKCEEKKQPFDLKALPGTCANLHDLTLKTKFFPTLQLSTFKKYQKASGICSFPNHAVSSTFYKELFPDRLV